MWPTSSIQGGLCTEFNNKGAKDSQTFVLFAEAGLSALDLPVSPPPPFLLLQMTEKSQRPTIFLSQQLLVRRKQSWPI